MRDGNSAAAAGAGAGGEPERIFGSSIPLDEARTLFMRFLDE